MKPLAQDLFRDPSAIKTLLTGQPQSRHLLGFFLDSSRGELNRSGLIGRPASVLPLDRLLGNRATLYYVDPRRSEVPDDAYLEAVEAFADQLNSVNLIPFRIDPPCLLLVHVESDRSAVLDCLDLDRRETCMWYLQVREFLASHIGQSTQEHDKSGLAHALEALSSRRFEISMEVLKTSLGGLISSLMGSR